MHKTLALGFSCITLALITGCTREDAVWLPDSSGIVQCRADGSIVHFAIGTGKETRLLQADWLKSQGGANLPAVAPDGQRVAIAKHTAGKQEDSVQFLFFDLSGQQTRASQVFKREGNEKLGDKSVTNGGRVFWSPDGRHLLFEITTKVSSSGGGLLSLFFGGSDDIAALGVYDLKTDSVRWQDDLFESSLTLIAGLSPCTPDGRGFLAEPLDMDESTPLGEIVYFVDWSGRKRSFSLTRGARRFEQRIKQDSDQMPDRDGKGMPVWPVGVWRNGVAQIPVIDGCLSIDPRKQLMDFDTSREVDQLWDAAKTADVETVDLGNRRVLQMQTITEGSAKSIQIRVVDRANVGRPTDKPCLATVDSVDKVVLSPDREYAIVFAQRKDGPRRLVISRDGTLVRDLAG